MRRIDNKKVVMAVAMNMIEQAIKLLIACEIDGRALNMLIFAETGIKREIRRART